MAVTYIKLATVTGGANILTFSSIPQTYKDLVIIGSGSSNFNADAADCAVQFNNDSGNNYSWTGFSASAGVISHTRSVGQDAVYFQMNAYLNSENIVSPVIMQILDYTNTSRRKLINIRSGYDNATVSSSALTANRWGSWSSTSAISSIKLIGSSGVAWTTSSTFNLYGLAGS